MDLTLYSGTFGFAKTNLGSTGTIIVGNSEMASYPYEVTTFGERAYGRTMAGSSYSYSFYERKHRWILHWEYETRETTDLLGSCFGTSTSFYFNPCPGLSTWYLVRNVDPEFQVREPYLDRFSFDVTLEET